MRPLSLVADMRGEAALSFLPERGQPPAETLIFADGLTAIDAWGAAALRTSIELYARRQQQQVTIGAPKDPAAWRLLYSLLEKDCPAHLRLSDDTTPPPPSRRPSAIVVPTIRAPTLERADEIAEVILDIPPSRLTRALRFVAQEVPELVANALTHADRSPTQPVLCVFYDRDEDEVQLVLCDLGATYDGDAEAAESLLAAVQAHPSGGLTTAVEAAAARGIDATLTLAAGSGRVYWRRGKWSNASAQAVSGFTAALTVPIAD